MGTYFADVLTKFYFRLSVKRTTSNDRTLVLVLLEQWGVLIVDLVVKLPSIARILVLVLSEALTVNSL